MITNVYLNGVEITGANTKIASVRDSISASIDVSDYKRGGRSGVALSTPYYRNFVISMEFWIFGSSTSDLVDKRDSFMSYLRLVADKSSEQKKTLGFKMANGITKEIPVIISDVRSEITPQNLQHSIVTVVVRTELEYFVKSVGANKTIGIYQGGGMAVPMKVPMDMGNPLGGSNIVITNNGNSEFYPIVRVDGYLSGFVLKNNTTNKSIEYSGTLNSSQFLYLDMYNRVALLNSTTNALADISGEWWYLAPGDNEILLITTSGSGGAEFLDYKDAYRGL
ncbi:MAG: hypothetical protein GYA14_10455 [Ignavibacteria bacterium]|nr:hypothetical protein [Ignavibacteria bacterium]